MIEKKATSQFKKFLLLWSGQLVSAIGGGLTSFGLGVYVFNQTGSAADMALVTLLAFLPTLLLSVPAGVLADRYDRRLLMMLGDGLSAIGIVYILICMLRGGAALYQICIGVFVSSVFSSLLEPAYRATVTDLLTKEEYSKASGMVSLAGSARYLISPLLAGLLLAVSNIQLLLILDICTFFLTVITTGMVKRELIAKASEVRESFAESLRMGWRAVTRKEGVIILILVSSVLTCFMGAFQILAEPLLLDFTSSTVLGGRGDGMRLGDARIQPVIGDSRDQKGLCEGIMPFPFSGGHCYDGVRAEGKYLPDFGLRILLFCHASLCQ